MTIYDIFTKKKKLARTIVVVQQEITKCILNSTSFIMLTIAQQPFINDFTFKQRLEIVLYTCYRKLMCFNRDHKILRTLNEMQFMDTRQLDM